VPGLYEDLLPKLAGERQLAPRERAALDLAERLTTAPATIDDAAVARLRAVFDDAELVELGFAVAGYLAWGRLYRAFDVPPSGEGYHAALAALAGAQRESRTEARPA